METLYDSPAIWMGSPPKDHTHTPSCMVLKPCGQGAPKPGAVRGWAAMGHSGHEETSSSSRWIPWPLACLPRMDEDETSPEELSKVKRLL